MEALGNCPVCPPLNPALTVPITGTYEPRDGMSSCRQELTRNAYSVGGRDPPPHRKGPFEQFLGNG